MGAELEQLGACFADPVWRVSNLYRVVDENGTECDFRPRPAQQQFLRNLWYRNIVLKARQLGFTTLIDIIGLDMAIFTDHLTAVIIAETKDKAADIFQRKVIYPYEHLPREIRDFCKIQSSSQLGEVSFSNGSQIKVMVSARSGTCQFLHVSEYGPVCAKAPAKAAEIKTGSLPAVHGRGFVFIESTAMGNAGDFYEMTMAAQALQRAGRKLDPLQYKLHFFPWHQNPEYRANPASVVIPDRLLAYFDELYGRQQIALSEEQMAWYAMTEATLHEKMWSEYPSYPDEAFRVARDGSYYAASFLDIYKTNRITTVPHEPALGVYTAWDLGVSDQTTIWFFQFLGKEIRVIDYYESSGEGLGHYASVLASKPYRYVRHFAPHDIAVRELGSGLSRLETARKFGINFDRIPTNLDLAGGIENVREMLAYCWFDEAKTETGRKALEAYKREWDEKLASYKSQPCHDWASHGADAFRTAAVAWKLGLVADPAGRKRVKTTGGIKKR